MNATDIPFVNLIGIKQNNNELSLEFSNDVLNHINTIHASAQFTLGETQSGLYLQKLFPELEGKVIPLLREAQIKYSKPASKKIIAYAHSLSDDIQKFQEQFEKKGRSSIQVHIEIKDINDIVTCKATFSWFIQKID